MSSVEPFAHFGLSTYTQVDSIQVIWPDGKHQVLRSIKSNQILALSYKQSAKIKTITDARSLKETVFKEVSEKYAIKFKHEEEDKIDFNQQRTLPHKYSQYGPGIAVGDINGDQIDDFYVAGSAGKKGVFYMQAPNGSFSASAKQITGQQEKPEEEMGVLLFDADNDTDLDLYAVSGSYEHEQNSLLLQDKLYKNNGKGIFTVDKSALPVFTSSGSCVKAADYDQDGDLDLFVGGRVIPGKYPLAPQSFILRNEGSKFTDVTSKVCPALTTLGMVSDALWSDFDNDGKVDLVIAGEWLPITFLKIIIASLLILLLLQV